MKIPPSALDVLPWMIHHLAVKVLFLMVPIAALNAAITYPETRTGDMVDDYHGTSVADPYRWMEDDNSEETKAWVAAQNEVTEAYLSEIPQREEIAARLKKLWNYERIGSPQRYGENYFFTHNTGLQNQSVLKVADKADGEGRTLLDPNKLSDNGTTSLARYAPSEDGKLLAYSISKGGSDWQEILVRDVASAKDLTDHLKWIKFSGISWKKDDWAWEKDYGSSENPEEFKALHAYSPLHNLKPGTRYPATLVSTADHDDRVAPAHSFKFAARLQKCQASDGPPVLIRIATSAGHGAGTALDKVIEKAADEISFLEANLK